MYYIEHTNHQRSEHDIKIKMTFWSKLIFRFYLPKTIFKEKLTYIKFTIYIKHFKTIENIILC